MPGCGKSTFGKRTSDLLQIEFIDLDKEIVRFEKKSISEIFEKMGEDHFRKIESSLLKKITSEKDHFIMATGGGAPCFFDNMDFMNSHGITFYINAKIEHLLNRLSTRGIDKRPLLKNLGEKNLKQGLTDKLDERIPYYSRAHHTIPYHEALENDLVFLIRSKT
jgi:shikimate kinase